MFHLDENLILALYPRTELAKDAGVPVGPGRSGEFSIGHLVPSKQDVDALLAQAEAAGATLTGPPHDRPWGIYSGYFRDLDETSGKSSGTPRVARRVCNGCRTFTKGGVAVAAIQTVAWREQRSLASAVGEWGTSDNVSLERD